MKIKCAFFPILLFDIKTKCSRQKIDLGLKVMLEIEKWK
jgi:hypothetical protein